MQKIIFAVVCLLIVVPSYQQKVSRLTVTSPPELIEKIRKYNQKEQKEDENAIECELANFGSAQYGTRTMGDVHVSNPINACNKTDIINHEEEFQRIPFLLVERGGCAFADKVYNAQEAGVKIVIIFDNQPVKSNVIMIDNGHGYNVHITSVFINYSYGTLIKSFLELNKDKSVTLSLELNQNKVDKSITRLWIDPASGLSSKMVHSFNPIRKRINGNNFETEPVFDIEKKTKISNSEDTNCRLFSNDRIQYCSPDPDAAQDKDQPVNKRNVATGGDVIDEAIRQLCVHDQDEEFWYQYYDYFGSYCTFEPQYYTKCNKVALLNVPSLDMDKYNACTKNETLKISLLDNQAANNDRFQIFEWPAVTINEILYRGNLDGDNIAEAICNSLDSVDDDCGAILDPSGYNEKKPDSSSSSSGILLTLVLIVVGFAIAFFITAYCYKRVVRKEISQDVDQKVNQMVSQYIAFYESRGKNTDNNQSDL